MPLYDYKCTKCGVIQEHYVKMDSRNEPQSCGLCSGPSERLVNGIPKSGAHVFRAGYYEHIAAEPIYCGSKADLRAVCREHNCTSDYAE